jgi:uncharacterized protein YegP (UPF0339 family)
MKEKARKTGIFIKRGSSGRWYWHLKGKNGKIIASGHGFNSKRNTTKSILSVLKFFKAHLSFEIFNQINDSLTRKRS